LLGLGDQLVSILGEVLLRLQYSVGHDDECVSRRDGFGG
jgi:hypothetical protein